MLSLHINFELSHQRIGSRKYDSATHFMLDCYFNLSPVKLWGRLLIRGCYTSMIWSSFHTGCNPPIYLGLKFELGRSDSWKSHCSSEAIYKISNTLLTLFSSYTDDY